MHLVGFIIRNLSRCTVTWTSNIYPYSHHEYRFTPGAASGLANSSICSRLFEPRTGFMQCPSTVTTRITCTQLTASSDMESSVNFFFLYWCETDLPGRSVHLQFAQSKYCVGQCRSTSCLILHQPFTNNCYSVTPGLDFIIRITNVTQNGVLPESYPMYGNSILLVATMGVVLRSHKYDVVSG